jgi:hypothetical protein
VIGAEMVSVERLHQLVDSLPEAERETAARLLERLVDETSGPVVSGATFFADGVGDSVLQPDVPPVVSIDELRGDFWPQDEGPDAFVNAVRAWRREGSNG